MIVSKKIIFVTLCLNLLIHIVVLVGGSYIIGLLFAPNGTHEELYYVFRGMLYSYVELKACVPTLFWALYLTVATAVMVFYSFNLRKRSLLIAHTMLILIIWMPTIFLFAGMIERHCGAPWVLG